MTRVEIQDTSLRYGATWAVRDFSAEIEPGEIFFLLGPSGCGKTTLLRAIAGLARPAMGEILFNGRPMNTVPPNERNVGFVFQNYALWPHLTVAENVEYGLVTRKVDEESRETRVAAALTMLGLDGLDGRYPGELSGGQQQRVAVARAIVVEPDVLLMDEPLSNLDARLRAEMRRELKALVRRLGVTTIYVTHDQREALSMADRIAVMRDGGVEQIGPARALYDFPRTEFVASFVGDANVVEGSISGLADGGFKVKTAAGTVLVSARGSFRTGDPVHLIVRPEDVSAGHGLVGDNSGDNIAYNIIEGRLADAAFAGGFEEVVVELPGAVRVTAFRRVAPVDPEIGAEPLELGEAIEIGFASGSARLFAAGDGEEGMDGEAGDARESDEGGEA